jgi:hypothetical protein
MTASTPLCNSLATPNRSAQVEVRLLSRSNEMLAIRRTDAKAACSSNPGLRAARAACRRPC